MSSSEESRFPKVPSIDWSIPLIRQNGRQLLRVVIVSHEWYGFHTHFNDGRTIACVGANECLLCEKSVPLRWCGTLIVGKSGSRGFSLFPFTQAVLPVIRSAFVQYETLCGVIAEFGRRTGDVRTQMTCTICAKRYWQGKVYTISSVKRHTDRIFGQKGYGARNEVSK